MVTTEMDIFSFIGLFVGILVGIGAVSLMSRKIRPETETNTTNPETPYEPHYSSGILRWTTTHPDPEMGGHRLSPEILAFNAYWLGWQDAASCYPYRREWAPTMSGSDRAPYINDYASGYVAGKADRSEAYRKRSYDR